MGVLSFNRGGLSILALAAAVVSPATALPSRGDWSDAVGRWRAAPLPNGAEPTLPIAAIEIVLCGETGLCGRIVREDGSCGAIVLRVDASPGPMAPATLIVGTARRQASVYRVKDGLTIEAYRPGANPLTRRTINPFARYHRDGPARCVEAVS